jgi:hypothetical protein
VMMFDAEVDPESDGLAPGSCCARDAEAKRSPATTHTTVTFSVAFLKKSSLLEPPPQLSGRFKYRLSRLRQRHTGH